MAKKQGFHIHLDAREFRQNLKRYQAKWPQILTEALHDECMQMMFWIVGGSPRESIKPPIDTGELRGTVFTVIDGKRFYLTDSARIKWSTKIIKKALRRIMPGAYSKGRAKKDAAYGPVNE